MVGFETISIPPPPDTTQDVRIETEEDPEKAKDESEAPALPQPAVVTLTDQQARSALLSFVSTHCCWGTGAVKQKCIAALTLIT